MPVLVSAAPVSSLLTRFPAAATNAFLRLGVRAAVVEGEVAEMADVRLGTTVSRRVVGSMTDFAFLFDGYRDGYLSLADISARLAEAPCGPLEMRSPKVVARELLGAGDPVSPS